MSPLPGNKPTNVVNYADENCSGRPTYSCVADGSNGGMGLSSHPIQQSMESATTVYSGSGSPTAQLSPTAQAEVQTFPHLHSNDSSWTNAVESATYCMQGRHITIVRIKHECREIRTKTIRHCFGLNIGRVSFRGQEHP